MIQLADTSALILARRNSSAGQVIAAASDRNELATCDLVELEYLMGARNAADYEAIERAFAGFRRLATDPRDWARARYVHRALAGLGPGVQRSVGIPDLIVAAVAERHGVGILHYDEDYDRLAGITGQPTRWIVPRGTA